MFECGLRASGQDWWLIYGNSTFQEGAQGRSRCETQGNGDCKMKEARPRGCARGVVLQKSLGRCGVLTMRDAWCWGECCMSKLGCMQGPTPERTLALNAKGSFVT